MLLILPMLFNLCDLTVDLPFYVVLSSVDLSLCPAFGFMTTCTLRMC
jgi:hypothetical protein